MTDDGDYWQHELESAFLRDTRRELEEDERASDPGSRRAEAPVVVELQEVELRYGDFTVLDGVSFEVHRGETLCILGGSGAGKSTILRLILLLTYPSGGRILVKGYDLTTCTLEEVLTMRQRMGMVFQASALFDSLTVYENVAFPLREQNRMDEQGIENRVREVLTIVDLEPEEVAELLPAELSGGMRKRVGIARAIAGSPEILLFDEPTSGLDPITTRTIDELINKLRRELGVSSVVVTHDIRSAFAIANRVALLHEGAIVFMGSPEEMIACEDEYVREFLR